MYYDYQIAGMSVLCLTAVSDFFWVAIFMADTVGVIHLTKLD